jgi:hypothetical protein
MRGSAMSHEHVDSQRQIAEEQMHPETPASTISYLVDDTDLQTNPDRAMFRAAFYRLNLFILGGNLPNAIAEYPLRHEGGQKTLSDETKASKYTSRALTLRPNELRLGL